MINNNQKKKKNHKNYNILNKKKIVNIKKVKKSFMINKKSFK